MLQKKPNRRTRLTTEENEVISETIRKSKLTASNKFELKKLTRAQEGFLNCAMEEEKESIVMTYEIRNLLPWTEIKRERKELMFSALIDAGKLEQRADIRTKNFYGNTNVGRTFLQRISFLAGLWSVLT